MNTLNYETAIIERFPWIISKNQNCVISPDCDGQLCALFMSQHFNWKVKGFYDGKILLIEKGLNPSSVIYLDVEIYRKDVRSVGQHMMLPNKNMLPSNWNNLNNCISANNLRGFDAKNDFKNKYPFGTIHLLVSIVGNIMNIKKNNEVIAPLLYADGTFKNIFGYPENSLSWFHFLKSKENNILNEVFFVQKASMAEMMELMKSIFKNIQTIGGNRGTERIKISERGGGQSTSVIKDANQVFIEKSEIEKSEKMLEMFASMSGWAYKKENWTWKNFTQFQFEKDVLQTTGFKKRNNLLKENPTSFAITATNRMEYTKFQKGVFD